MTTRAEHAHVKTLSRSRYARAAGAASPWCPVDDLVRLIDDGSPIVQAAAWANMRMPREKVEAEIAFLGHYKRHTPAMRTVIEGLLQRPDLTVEDLDTLGTVEVLRHPHYPADRILQILQHVPTTQAGKIRKTEECRELSQNPNLTEEAQLLLAPTRDKKVRVNLSKLENLYPSVIERLLTDISAEVLENLSLLPAAQPYERRIAAQLRVAHSRFISTRVTALLAKYETDRYELEKALQHKSPTVIVAALQNNVWTETDRNRIYGVLASSRRKEHRRVILKYVDCPVEYQVMAVLAGGC